MTGAGLAARDRCPECVEGGGQGDRSLTDDTSGEAIIARWDEGSAEQAAGLHHALTSGATARDTLNETCRFMDYQSRLLRRPIQPVRALARLHALVERSLLIERPVRWSVSEKVHKYVLLGGSALVCGYVAVAANATACVHYCVALSYLKSKVLKYRVGLRHSV